MGIRNWSAMRATPAASSCSSTKVQSRLGFAGRQPHVTLSSFTSQVIPDIRRAIQYYELSRNIEWQLRAKMLLADVAVLTGDEDLAKETAGEVFPVAEAFQFDNITRQARDHLAGDPVFRQMQRDVLASLADDPDVRDAKRNDDAMERHAEEVLDAAGLPRDRLPVVKREVLSLRDIARERLDWCRHIQLIQALGHTRSPDTYYARDPERHCYCDKLEFASKIGSTDWPLLIETFKSNYCSGCAARSPKGGHFGGGFAH